MSRVYTAAEVFDDSLRGATIRLRIARCDLLLALMEPWARGLVRAVAHVKLDRAEAVITRREAIAELEGEKP